jgi:hypothetical protein
MGFVRKTWATMTCALLLTGGMPAAAEPPEPLIVTRLADPDPNFVERRRRKDDDDAIVDAAMADFGRALGQALLAQQQLIDQRCKATAASPADRMAWEAACRYARH